MRGRIEDGGCEGGVEVVGAAWQGEEWGWGGREEGEEWDPGLRALATFTSDYNHWLEKRPFQSRREG